MSGAAGEPALRLPNRTRRAPSIPRKLLAEGKGYLLPLYWAMLSSDLAREGIANSGSYRFADHIYRGAPSGRGGVGAALDRALLALPSARSFRNRFRHARKAVAHVVRRASARHEEARVLSVPSGIARELAEAALELRQEGTDAAWFAMDLDPQPLALTETLLREHALEGFTLLRGDALDGAAYPTALHAVTCTGLAEFLDDMEAERLYRACHGALRTGGWLITSATRRHALSDYLLRNLGELHTHYREAAEVRALLRGAGFRHVYAGRDKIGYQTLVVAVK